MSYIGGFYELEIKPNRDNNYHNGALALTNARACLSLILSVSNVKKVYVPFYTCNALLEPLIEKGIEYSFYAINEELELKEIPDVKEQEFIIYVNYFGLKTHYIQKLMSIFDRKLVLDNTQAYLYNEYENVWAFNSARKFFGVPDGGYLYGLGTEKPEIERNTDIKLDHLVNRYLGRQDIAFQDFLAYEKTLNSDVKSISKISEILLTQVDYNEAIKKRRENFKLYEKAFITKNQLRFDMAIDEIPFSFPLLLDKLIDKRQLHKQGLFVPTLWPDVISRVSDSFQFEKSLSEHLLPLPLDHRYGPDECQRVIDSINELL